MNVDGKDYTERKKSGDALIAFADKNAKQVIDSRKAMFAGKIAGYRVMLSPGFARVNFEIQADENNDIAYVTDAFGNRLLDTTTRLEKEPSAVGIIRQLENTAKNVSTAAEPMADSIGRAEKLLEELNNDIKATFQYGDELAEKSKRLDEINQTLEDSDGDIPVVPDATVSNIDTPEFKAWFNQSKVVDENGKPLVVYHGYAV